MTLPQGEGLRTALQLFDKSKIRLLALDSKIDNRTKERHVILSVAKRSRRIFAFRLSLQLIQCVDPGASLALAQDDSCFFSRYIVRLFKPDSLNRNLSTSSIAGRVFSGLS